MHSERFEVRVRDEAHGVPFLLKTDRERGERGHVAARSERYERDPHAAIMIGQSHSGRNQPPTLAAQIVAESWHIATMRCRGV